MQRADAVGVGFRFLGVAERLPEWHRPHCGEGEYGEFAVLKEPCGDEQRPAAPAFEGARHTKSWARDRLEIVNPHVGGGEPSDLACLGGPLRSHGQQGNQIDVGRREAPEELTPWVADMVGQVDVQFQEIGTPFDDVPFIGLEEVTRRMASIEDSSRRWCSPAGPGGLGGFVRFILSHDWPNEGEPRSPRGDACQIRRASVSR